MQIIAFRLRAGDEFMPTDEQHREDTTRYAIYVLAAMSAAMVLAFLFLFNFTTFFRLAVPL